MEEKLRLITNHVLRTKLFKTYQYYGNGVTFPIKWRSFDPVAKEGHAGFVQVTVNEDDSVQFDLLFNGGKTRLTSKQLFISAEDVPRYLFSFIFTRLANYFSL